MLKYLDTVKQYLHKHSHFLLWIQINALWTYSSGFFAFFYLQWNYTDIRWDKRQFASKIIFGWENITKRVGLQGRLDLLVK